MRYAEYAVIIVAIPVNELDPKKSWIHLKSNTNLIGIKTFNLNALNLLNYFHFVNGTSYLFLIFLLE